jgi:hypothetical protein
LFAQSTRAVLVQGAYLACCFALLYIAGYSYSIGKHSAHYKYLQEGSYYTKKVLWLAISQGESVDPFG